MNSTLILSDTALLAATIMAGLHCSEQITSASITDENHRGYRYGEVEACQLKPQFCLLSEIELKRWAEGEARSIFSSLYPGHVFIVIAHAMKLPHGCVQLQITADCIN